MTTRYYEQHLAELHQRLLVHAVAQTYLTGTGIRFDGAEMSAADQFELALCTSVHASPGLFA